MAKNYYWTKGIKNGSHRPVIKTIQNIEEGMAKKKEGKYTHIVYVSYDGSNGSARKNNLTNEIELFVAKGQRREIYFNARRIDDEFFDVYRDKERESRIFVVGDFTYWQGINFSRGFSRLEDLEDPSSVVLSSILLTIANSEKYSLYKGETTEWELGSYMRSIYNMRRDEIPKSHVMPKRNAFSIYDYYKKGVSVSANF